MASIIGVTLNQPSNLDTQDVLIERFAVLYQSEKDSGAAPFADVPLPPIQQISTPARLDLTTTAERDGTRVTAELSKPVTDANGQTTSVSQTVSVFLEDVDAYAATAGLAKALEASDEDSTQAISDDAMATRLFGELQALLSDLSDLFDDLDLVLFAPLPDDATLPSLDQYDFSDPYFERFWQLTWATWSGERPYDAEMMFGLGLRSSSVMQFAVDFNRRIMESVVAVNAEAPDAET